MSRHGVIISIEGGDGAGKHTQSKLLAEWGKELGLHTYLDSYPRYDGPAAEHVKRYLNGRYGPDAHPELTSLPYAIDRHLGAPAIKKVRKRPDGFVVLDRHTSANLGHMGSKFETDEERLEYFEFQRNYEYDILGIPKPDQTFLLQVPPETAQRNVDQKAQRKYTDKKRDIHEADAEHLLRTYHSFQLLADTYPDEFSVINPMEADGVTMRSIDSIQEELRQKIRPMMGYLDQ